MHLKSIAKRVTAVTLSMAMALSLDVASNFSNVYAAGQTKASEKVLSVYDMKNATIEGNFQFVASYKDGEDALLVAVPQLIQVLAYPKTHIRNLEDNWWDTELSGKVAYIKLRSIDKYYGIKESEIQDLSDYDISSYNERYALIKEYFEYISSIGLVSKDTKDDDKYILPATLTVNVGVSGKIVDENNAYVDISLSLLGSEQVNTISIEYTNGKFSVEVWDIVKTISYFTGTTPDEALQSILPFKIPVSLDGLKIDIFGTALNASEYFMNMFQGYVEDDYYYGYDAESDERMLMIFGTINMILSTIAEKNGGTDGIGAYFVEKSKTLVEIIGLATDNTIDKYTTVEGGKDCFNFTEKDLIDIAVSALEDTKENSNDIADKVVGVVEDFMEFDKESRAGAVDTVVSVITNFIDGNLPYLKGEEEEKPETPPVQLLADIDSSLTGEKGSRDLDVTGEIAVTPTEEILSTLEPNDVDKVALTFNLCVKEPAKAEPTKEETKLDGPEKGKKIADKKYKYKVTKQGGTDGTVGELQVTGLKKKSLTAAKIAAVVTIDGVKYKVTSIAPKAFKGNKKFTKVTIGKNVKSIGANAFANNAKLKAVTINSTALKSIGKSAFAGNKNLAKVIIKSTKLKKVGKKAFYRKGGKKLTIRVPKKKKKAYTKLVKKAKTNKYVVK